MPAEALSHPLTDEGARKQLIKTGNTPFVFEELEIDIEEGLFLTVTVLNEMRRKALELLENKLIKGYARITPEKTDASQAADPKVNEDGFGHAPALTCLVQNADQLYEAQKCSAVRRIYIDCMMWMDGGAPCGDIQSAVEKVRSGGRECFLALPPIWRTDARAAFDRAFPEERLMLFDGFLLRHTDQILSFKKWAGSRKLVSDSGMYVFNSRSAAFLKKNGFSSYTLPAELNAGELKSVSGPDAELTVYGYLPVMVCAQCLRKNTSKCTKTPSVMMLEDKTGARFPVRNCCSICTNIIYNSLPLSLNGKWEQIMKIKPGFLRLSFTIEDADKVRRVLSCWENPEGGKAEEAAGNYTRGHFARGVE